MKMEHITLNTADIEASIRFYEQVVGLKITGDLRGMGMPIVFLANGEGETAVELIHNPDEPFSAVGLSVGFHVEDVEAKRAELDEAGFAPTPIVSPNPATKFFFVKDPNGLNVQFI